VAHAAESSSRATQHKARGWSAPPLLVCSYEDRPAALDGLILMVESLCRCDGGVCLHLTVPEAPSAFREWATHRPEVTLSTGRPAGVSGWDVKPWLLLQELNGGSPQALWLDADMIVTRPVSSMVAEFPADSLIVAQEWFLPKPRSLAPLWGLPAARSVTPVNSCFVRVTPAHRPLLERWLCMTREPRYREAQKILPMEKRPFHLWSDQALLTALLGSAEFGGVSIDYIRLGRHIAQCAGSSGYRVRHRIMDLFRGLPPLIHCIGRKPWDRVDEPGALQRLLTDSATDVSPYVLAARRVARDLDMHPAWLDARTPMGALLRGLTFGHPGMAGLPLAVPHELFTKMTIRRAPKE
jgi:hypothetical protein